VRFGLRPGEGLRGGLEPTEDGSNFWVIGDDYLKTPQ
jgi:hypothetical protein